MSVRSRVILVASLMFAGAACEEHDLGKPCGACANGEKDGTESDVDCGGWCGACALACGPAADRDCTCNTDFDCASGNCTGGACALPAPASGERIATREAVGQSTGYPCESLICIASQGKPGYCSQKCRNDAGCPAGFECKEIMSEGEFAGEKFCAWKSCNARGDCGTVEEFCCSVVPGVDPEHEVKLCEHSDEGKCG